MIRVCWLSSDHRYYRMQVHEECQHLSDAGTLLLSGAAPHSARCVSRCRYLTPSRSVAIALVRSGAGERLLCGEHVFVVVGVAQFSCGRTVEYHSDAWVQL